MLEGPISTLKLFSPWPSDRCPGAYESCIHPEVAKLRSDLEKARHHLHPSSDSPSFVLSASDSFTLSPEGETSTSSGLGQDLRLIVGGALGYAIVYNAITKNGLEKPEQLERSDIFDSVLSCEVTDIDWDGCNEILITTFSQELLIYKLTMAELTSSQSLSRFLSVPSRSLSFSKRLQQISDMARKRNMSQPSFSKSDASTTPIRSLTVDSVGEVSEEPNKKTKNEEEEEQAPKYRLAMRQSYPEPIFNVRAVDLTSDGVNEIVVSSLRGLHVAQVDLHLGRYRVLQRLGLLNEIAQLEQELLSLEAA